MLTARHVVHTRSHYLVYKAGLGTLKLTPEALCRGVTKFPLVDTAKAYGNEAIIGTALKETGYLNRVSVVTKLHRPCLESKSTLQSAVQDSIDKLGKVPEFMLIHGPYPDVNMIHMMDVLEVMKKSGLIREWGVSNFSHEHLDFLEGHHLHPVLNQVEYSPHFQQRDLLAYCKKHSIALQAYRPLGEGKVLEDPTIIQLATKYRVSPASLVYSWLSQQDIAIVSKVSSESHQDEYAMSGDIKLSAEDMILMESLHKADGIGRTCTKGGWFVPFTAEVELNWMGSLLAKI